MRLRASRTSGSALGARAGLAAVLAAAGLLAGGCGASGLKTNAPPRSVSPARDTYLLSCGGKAVHKPRSLVLACADAGDILSKITWRNWGHSTATANAKQTVETCKPNCASGTTAVGPATIVASDLALHGSAAVYRKLKVVSATAAPSGKENVQLYTLSSYGPGIDSTKLVATGAYGALPPSVKGKS